MGVVLRLTATLAIVIGLAAFGLAIGDFASHPNPLGALGLVALFVLGGVAVRQLYRPGGVLSRRAAPQRREPEPREPRRRPSQRATSASLFDDD
jgi:hypothetical protein